MTSAPSRAAVILPFTPKRRGPCVDPAQRGHHVAYRGDGHDRCPGCGRSHWWVGRVSAQCAFCGTALLLLETPAGPPPMWTRGRVDG